MKKTNCFITTLILIILSSTVGLGYYPEIELIYPPVQHFKCASSHIPLTGKTVCENCVLTINDEIVDIARMGHFQKNQHLRPGINHIELILKDSIGNEIIKKLEITNTIPGDTFSINSPGEKQQKKDFLTRNESSEYTENIRPEISISSEKKDFFEKDSNPVFKKGISFFIEGKRIQSNKDFLAINRKNHVMIPLESQIWSKTGATMSAGNKSITFLRNSPFKKRTVFLNDLINPQPLITEDKTYLPVRSIFENAGWQVHWQQGNIYLSRQNNLIPIQITGTQDSKLETLLFHDVTFLSVENLLDVKGINIEAVGSSGVRIIDTSSGKNIEITRIGERNNGLEMIIKISGDRAPPCNYIAPGKQITENEYLIPVRPVLEQFGFDVRWDSETKTVKAVSEFSVSRTN